MKKIKQGEKKGETKEISVWGGVFDFLLFDGKILCIRKNPTHIQNVQDEDFTFSCFSIWSKTTVTWWGVARLALILLPRPQACPSLPNKTLATGRVPHGADHHPDLHDICLFLCSLVLLCPQTHHPKSGWFDFMINLPMILVLLTEI